MNSQQKYYENLSTINPKEYKELVLETWIRKPNITPFGIDKVLESEKVNINWYEEKHVDNETEV